MKKLLEKEFTYYTDTYDDFIYLKGRCQTLISAPHSVTQTREGATKLAETETGYLALHLNNIGFPCIIKTSNCDDDANFDLDSSYKNFITNLKNKPRFLIDLHKMKWERDIDICIGTGENDVNLLSKVNILPIIKNIFLDNNLKTAINNPFSANSPRTISKFCSNNGIPSIQLEINAKLINTTDDNFNSFCSVLEKVIMAIEEHI